jgi:hypothetical protein
MIAQSPGTVALVCVAAAVLVFLARPGEDCRHRKTGLWYNGRGLLLDEEGRKNRDNQACTRL